MDPLTAAAAHALAHGDVLGALKHVSLRDDPPALALRGIAMAQLGDYVGARELLRRAARGFGTRDALGRARCVVADAEVALAMRELQGGTRTLTIAATVLESHGDRANAQCARLLAVRRLLLLGRLDDAARALAAFDTRGLPPMLSAVIDLAMAELALRSLQTAAARDALLRAASAARAAGIPALEAEVAETRALLERPAARRIDGHRQHLLRLDEVAALFTADTLVIDACRRHLHAGRMSLPFARRPVLFALLQVLAAAWPADVARHTLIERAFATRHADESHRARLRVEIGRLRKAIAACARIDATSRGFQLTPLAARAVCVLAPPVDGEQAALEALLADGAAWSTSALALALGTSQRSVQRALVALEAAHRVRAVGRARARRWLAPPLTGITTILLLPVAESLA